MERITLKFAEYPDYPQGYGLLDPPTSIEHEGNVWDFIYKNMPEGKKYLKHFIKSEWIQTEGYHYGYGNNEGSMKIPMGILTYYIDLYYEDK